MSNGPVYVSMQLGAETHLVGKLWWRGGKASFEYDAAWLGHAERFALDPALQLGGGKFHTMEKQAMFGAIGDSSPDNWGRLLMRRNAAKDGSPAPSELDYLLKVSDEVRQGALRFSLTSASGPYLSDTADDIPSIDKLSDVFSATNRYLDDAETEEDLVLLLAPGSSVGGARPKASVRDRDGNLVLVKFPGKGEQHNVVMWEAVALTLAGKAGIDTAQWRPDTINDKRVLILHRFDRVAGKRVPFLSARSMLAVNDYDRGSYLDIAHSLAQHGASPDRDMEELWRRIVFTVMISNLDDHLRNHGFLYEQGKGWRLSPAYDINPEPTMLGDPTLSTPIKYDAPLASIDVALSVIGDFRIARARATKIIREVASAVREWRSVATELGLDKREMDIVAPAFRHEG